MAKSIPRWVLWCVLPLVPAMGVCVLAQDEIYVDPDNAGDDGTYATIQEAIDAVAADPAPANTIIVETGSYEENLTIVGLGDLNDGNDISISIRGRETARVLLQPKDTSRPAVLISDSAKLLFADFTLVEFEVGISVNTSTEVTVAGNEKYQTFTSCLWCTIRI